MITLIDIIIIAIAFIAGLGALLLLRPQVDLRDAHKIRKLRHQAEKDQKLVAQVLNTVEFGAKDTEYLTSQLKSRVAQINQDNKTSHSRAKDAERAINKAKTAERELQSISMQLGERIQQLQKYWDGQLTETSNNVKQVKAKLQQNLGQAEDGLGRLQEQEKMAQGFTHKLLQHQKEHLSSQQKNAQMSVDVHQQLENILKESATSLKTIQQYQQQANQLYSKYEKEIQHLDQQARENFTDAFQTTDMARQELAGGLQEAREQAEKMRQYEIQGHLMSDRIREQFDQVDSLEVDRLGQTIGLTDEMCSNLQEGLENARTLLSTLEAKTAEVLGEHEDTVKPAEEATPILVKPKAEPEPPRNLFSLRVNHEHSLT